MKTIFEKLFRKSETVEIAVKTKPAPPSEGMENLIKMKEAMKLIKASAPTVRKYARLGYYKEYRFGEKLVFYNREEMLNFILSGSNGKK
ncbi:hypothetical protein BN938_2427 [Mucinivorans hirudinis]|uniref:Helix-turn-helix domain-containing protein n=1 Tax=Mucinivorans hirudinis TaxID=1433126 RepID=A0A060RA84_9BACT|nr:hypothetical protein BN938_2427 [Mucinivorans hirudinis]